jgi:3-oxoacyl-[acyl-carrier-protein] synthase II
MTTVVITGVGAVTPLGLGVEETWRAACAGKNAIGPIRRFDASRFPVTFAAEVDDPGVPADTGRWSLPPDALFDLKARLTFAATREALEMAGHTASGPRVGVCMGSEASRPPLDRLAERMLRGKLPSAAELARLAPQAPADLVAHMAGAEGPRSTISTACTSSSQAVGEGLLRIRRGEADVMIVGGVDVLVDPLMVTGFALLGALSTRNDAPHTASRPFDIDRNGFVLGEGAGMLVLESAEHARARGATVLGVLSGFGCSCNAYRITDSPPDGRGAFQSMRAALADANLQPSDIGYINAHGTSTPMNDASETAGIKRAFGDAVGQVSVSSTKSMTGHLVAACGAVEVILCMLAVRDGILPPTRNLDHPDPACDLRHIPHRAEHRQIRHAMTNAFGFGGSNGTVIVSSADAL